MISDIYIPTMTILMKYYNEKPFYEYVVEELPFCINDHLPGTDTFVSIEYQKDKVIQSLLEYILWKDLKSIVQLKKKGVEFEIGVFHLQLEGYESLVKKRLPGVEFVLQNLHQSYSFISSYHFYLDQDGIRKVCKMHTFESDIDEDDDFENPSEYANLLESYFYHGNIPDSYSDEVAKMVLLQGRL